MDNEKVIHVDKQFIFESGSINTIINGGTFNGNVYTCPQEGEDEPVHEVEKEPHQGKTDEVVKDDFDAQAVLDYVAKLNTGSKEVDEKCAEFWDMLIDKSEDLKVVRYNKYECCFARGRAEDKTVNFSKKFVCCVIGYVKNATSAYSASYSDLCKMLGEVSEPDSARVKDMQHCLQDYDKSVERVVKGVIEEIFG